MKPKVYLAARFSRFPEMRKYRDQLEEVGYEVTSRWINGEHQLRDGETFADSERARFAMEDSEDLVSSDICICFTEEPAPKNGRGRGGRHVEFGMALAMELKIYTVGYRENVFYCLPDVRFFEEWEDCLEVLKALR